MGRGRERYVGLSDTAFKATGDIQIQVSCGCMKQRRPPKKQWWEGTTISNHHFLETIQLLGTVSLNTSVGFPAFLPDSTPQGGAEYIKKKARNSAGM